jgi:N-acetylglucosamine kinase-like BadF-type ATPase
MNVLAVGVDVGATKTHVRVSRDGRLVRDEVIASDGWSETSRLASARWLGPRLQGLVPEHAAAEQSETGSAVTPPANIQVAVGAHACETPAQAGELAAHLAEFWHAGITVVNDAELVVPAAGLTAGIGVIAGTGSIVVGRHARTGEYMSAGGWGWVLGDEGSASALVRDVVRTLTRRVDAGESVAGDPVLSALLASYQVADLETLVVAMSWDGGVDGWGAHAPVVFDAAAAGSVASIAAIEQGGRDLAEQVDWLHRRGAAGTDVVAAGGVMTRQPRLRDAFTAELAQRLPDMRVHLLEQPPVAGALALASRAAEAASLS